MSESKKYFVAIHPTNHKSGSKMFRKYGEASYGIKSCASDEPHRYEVGKDDVRLHEDLVALSTADGIPFQYWTPDGEIGTIPKVLFGNGVYLALLPEKAKAKKTTVSIADRLAEIRNKPAVAIN